MTQAAQQLEEILDQLVKDVEGSVHAFYRGDHQQNTTRIKSDGHRKTAREALLALLNATPPRPDAPCRPGTSARPGRHAGPDKPPAPPVGAPTAYAGSRCGDRRRA